MLNKMNCFIRHERTVFQPVCFYDVREVNCQLIKQTDLSILVSIDELLFHALIFI